MNRTGEFANAVAEELVKFAKAQGLYCEVTRKGSQNATVAFEVGAVAKYRKANGITERLRVGAVGSGGSGKGAVGAGPGGHIAGGLRAAVGAGKGVGKTRSANQGTPSAGASKSKE